MPMDKMAQTGRSRKSAPLGAFIPLLLLPLCLAGCGTGGNGNGNKIILNEGDSIGKVTFAEGDTPNGGGGTAIDMISCDSGQSAYHVHVHLSIFFNGVQIALPEGIGIPNPQELRPGLVNNGNCFYWLHTHDHTGNIHVEAPAKATYTLGNFFDVWGELLTTSNVASLEGPVTAYVDGVAFTGDPATITLTPYKEITLEVGTPLVTPPVYIFPLGY
ncbi:MAG: hypothetical protein M3Y56_01255 [Armatimonadota bacterium]|nr:hypothetical protein [Armatimonadota bacterium]